MNPLKCSLQYSCNGKILFAAALFSSQCSDHSEIISYKKIEENNKKTTVVTFNIFVETDIFFQYSLINRKFSIHQHLSLAFNIYLKWNLKP